MIKKEEVAENPLTPQQLHQLGQIYRLILSWRKERLSKVESPRQPEPTERSSHAEQIISTDSET
jgi:hypothetical protein